MPDNPLFEEWKAFTESEVNFHIQIKNVVEQALETAFRLRASADHDKRWHHTFIRSPQLVVAAQVLGRKLVDLLLKLWKDDSRTAKVLLRSGISQLKTFAPGLYSEIRELMREQDGL